jgi:hypothetical protein
VDYFVLYFLGHMFYTCSLKYLKMDIVRTLQIFEYPNRNKINQTILLQYCCFSIRDCLLLCKGPVTIMLYRLSVGRLLA